jgi:hypothetical protein
MNYGTRLTFEDRVATLFQLDPVLPAQYQETFQRKTHLEPEKTLMLAVLEDAILCFQRYAGARNGKTRRLFRDAEDWILEKESKWFFSFDQICSFLGFEPGYIRLGLMREKEKLSARAFNAKHGPGGGTGKKKCKRKRIALAA